MTKTINNLVLAASLIAVVCAGYARRWITDDALIIIRTLDQIAAGNGPTFNAAERVETNTSTLWQWYLYFAHVITRQSFESVMHISCYLFAMLAVFLAFKATADLAQKYFKGSTLILPFGVLAFYASPGSRDFITSGLEWSFATAWLAACWWLAIKFTLNQTRSWKVAFLVTAGLGWLVRPEFALYTVLFLFWYLICIYFRSGKKFIALIGDFAVALAIPAAYEIFRMGYYGNLVPQTAVVKTGTRERIKDGLLYISDFFYYYKAWLLIVLLVYLIGVIVFLVKITQLRLWRDATYKKILVFYALFLFGALIQTAYVVRNGGDFMHARMLILPLFVWILPLGFIPVPAAARKKHAAIATAMLIICAGTVTRFSGFETEYSESSWMRSAGDNTIALERGFYTHGGKDLRLTAEDYDGPVGTRVMDDSMRKCEGSNWKCAVIDVRDRNVKHESPQELYWRPNKPDAGDLFADLPPVLLVTNLGSVSNNQPLNVVIHDKYGLSDPIGGRTANLFANRVGHSKQTNIALALANSSLNIDSLEDGELRNQVIEYRRRLSTPEVQEFMATYQEPMSASRFLKNIRWALTKSRTFKFDQEL